MKYIKKPVIITAIQWNGNNKKEILDFIDNTNAYISEVNGHTDIVVHTLEGDMHASIGDFIIRGVKCEYYPCKPDIFWETYDIAEE